MSQPAIILLLTQAGLAVYKASQQTVVHLGDFPDDPQSQERLQCLIHEWRASNFHLLIDLAEEEFHYESAPYLARADREALFQRKLDQAFPLTPYRRMTVQVPGKRGSQSRLMLSALTARKKIDTIVDRLLAAHCAITGIHSVALASTDLLQRLQLAIPHLLLITPSAEHCARQSYFTPDGLRYSRLTNEPVTEDSTNTATAEVRQTRHFLASARQIGHEDTLTVLLITDGDNAQASAVMQQLQADAPLINASTETAAQFATHLKLPAEIESWPELLCLAISRKLIPDHYRPIAAGRYQQLRQLGKALYWSAALVALLAAAIVLQSIASTRQRQEDITLATRQLHQQLERKQDLDSKLKALNTHHPKTMTEAVTLYRTYMADWPDIEPTAQAISQILADFPQLSLTRFAWHAHTGPQLPATQENYADPALTPPSLNPVFDGQRWQIVELAGALLPAIANERQALEQVEQLAARLSRLPRASVKILNQPLDLTPQGQISGGERDLPAPKDFLIRLVIAPPGARKP